MIIQSLKKQWFVILLGLILTLIPTRIALGQTPNHESALVSGDTLEVLTDVVQAYQTDGDLLEAMRSLDTWDTDVLLVAIGALENDESDAKLAETAATLHKELLLPDDTIQIGDLLKKTPITLVLALSIGLLAVGSILLMLPQKVVSHAVLHADAFTQRVSEARTDLKTAANNPQNDSEDNLDDLIGSIAEIGESVDNDKGLLSETASGSIKPESENQEPTENEADESSPRAVTTVKLDAEQAPHVVQADKVGKTEQTSEIKPSATPETVPATPPQQLQSQDSGAADAAASAGSSQQGIASSTSAPEVAPQEPSAKDNVAALLEDVFSDDEQGSEDLKILDEGLEDIEMTQMIKTMLELSRRLRELNRAEQSV